MKKCSSPEELAALTLGRITARRRRQLLSHVRNCARCRMNLGRQAAVIAELSSADIPPEGVDSLSLVEPRPELGRELHVKVFQAIEQAKHRTHRLRTLVETLLGEFLPVAPPAAEPATLSFRTKSPGVSGSRPKSAEAAIKQRFCRVLNSLLEKLLDPGMPADRRARWLARLNSDLEKMHAKALGQPASKLGARNAPAKARPKRAGER